VGGGGLVEAGDHIGGLGGQSGIGGDQQPGVVINEVEDVDLGAVHQAPVGEVGLPALVGQVGFEADRGALGSLVGLWGDKAPLGQDAPDRGGRGRAAMPLGKVERDRVRASVQALVGQGLTELDDLIGERLGVRWGLVWGRRDRGARPASPSAS
jgi:hypothetical protein